MKRSLLFKNGPESTLVLAGTGLIAATYGLVRLAYGLFLPDVSASLGLAPDTAGQVSSCASLAYCLAAVGGLVAADRPRRLVLAAVVTAVSGSVAMALAPGVATFAVGAVVGSAGAGFASPGLVGLVERNVTRTRRAQAQSVVNAGTGPGLVGAAALALLLLPDWRLGLALGGAITLVAGIAVLRLDRSSGTSGSGSGSSKRPLTASAVRRLLVPALGALLLGAASAAVWTYGRTLLVSAGAGALGSSLAWTALGLGGTVTVATARRLSAVSPPRAWLLSTTTVASATVTLGLGARHLPVSLVACAVFGWGFVAASSALISWCVLVTPQGAAAGTSVLFVMLVLGQAVGSSAVGASSDLRTAFVLAAVVAVLAAACGALPGRPADVPGTREALVTPTGRG